ncbi:MAG: T9SS type A sorting domain-containing protein [Bacteroidota bacterium]
MNYLKRTVLTLLVSVSLYQTAHAQAIPVTVNITPSQTQIFYLEKSNATSALVSSGSSTVTQIFQYTGDVGSNYDFFFSYHRYMFTHPGIANSDITNVKYSISYNAHNQLGKPATYWANSNMSAVIPPAACNANYWTYSSGDCVSAEYCLNNGSTFVQGISTNNSTLTQSTYFNITSSSSPSLTDLLLNTNDFTFAFLPHFGALNGWIDISSLTFQMTYNTYPISNNTITGNESRTGGYDPTLITGGTLSGGSNAYTYQWQYSFDNVTWNNVSLNGTSANYDPTPISQTTYFRRVVNSTPQAPSTSNVITKTVIPIAAPANFASNPVNSTTSSIYLTWNASTGATSYNIYTCSGTPVATNVTNLYYTVTGLSPNTVTTYMLNASNAYSSSGLTACINAYTSLNTPVMTLQALGTQITITWPAVPGATYYEVSDGSSVIASPTTNSYVISGLSPNTFYSYRVRAVNPNVGSQYCALQSIATIPVAPASLSALAATNSQIQLYWSHVATAQSYDVFDCAGNYIANVPVSMGEICVINGLSSNTYYSYKVVAKNSAGSAVATACAGATTLLDTPTGLTALPGCSYANLSWNSVANATSYDVYNCNSGSGTFLFNTTSTNVNVTGLSNNTSYTFKVIAKNSVVNSDFTSCIAVSVGAIPGTVSQSALILCSTVPSSLLTLTGYLGDIQWQMSECNNPYTDITGERSATYNVTSAIAAGTSFRAKVSCRGDASSTVYSNMVTVFYSPATCFPITIPRCKGSRRLGNSDDSGNDDSSETPVLIYPNPSTDKLNIEINQTPQSDLNVLIYDVLGKVVYKNSEKNITGSLKLSVDVSGLQKGMYFLKLNDGSDMYYNKIIVE